MNTLPAWHYRTRTILKLVLVLSFIAGQLFAQTKDRGPLLTVDFSGSSMDPAWVFKLDTTAGYRFNSHLEIDFGLPVYFVHVQEDSIDGYSSKNGIGNAYIDLRVMLSHKAWGFSSELRGTAPTGDKDNGFSSGRATLDWTNYINLSLGKWTPFGSLGIANTVSDVHFFNRPFTSLGLVGHVEGGITIDPISRIRIGGSGYAVLPSGEQKIYSKVIRGQGNGSVAASGSGKGRNRPFETESVTIGESEIAKDHGVSGWIEIYPSSNVTFELGYSRSISYEANSLFFSARFDFGQMLRKSNR